MFDFQIAIFLRPFLYEFLEEMKKLFQIYVFTAGERNYATSILDCIDPEGVYIEGRLFRDSCQQSEFGFLKNLDVFANRNLKDVVLVDNSIFSCAMQLDNGVPVLPFFFDPEDRELLFLMEYLREKVHPARDVREENKKAFDL